MIGALLLYANLATQVLIGGSTVDNVAMDEQYLIARDTDTVGGRNYTVAIPNGGRLEFSTITIPSGVTLRFRRNAMNDPVYLLASGDVNIAGTVDVDGAVGNLSAGGAGGPGGYDGGEPGFGLAPGAGHGPGGGRFDQTTPTANAHAKSAASHRTIPSGAGGPEYGAASCFPLIGGSGGAGSPTGGGGGGGGGAILIASEKTITVSGVVRAEPGTYHSTPPYSGSGSGGCIRLVAPTVKVTGTLSASGGHGGAGAVRVDTINRSGLGGSNYTVGSNMVVRLDPMPIISTVSANGVPQDENNQEPIVVTTPSVTDIPIVVDIANFQSCVLLEILAVPGSGAAMKSTYLRGNGIHDFSVTIPPNTATAIEVYGKAVACAQ